MCAGASLVLDARFITGLSDGSAITTWANRGASSWSFTQGTAGSRPVFKARIRASNPVVRFDAVDDGLIAVNTYALANQFVLSVVSGGMIGGGRVFSQDRGAATGPTSDSASPGYIPLVSNGSGIIASYTSPTGIACAQSTSGWAILAAKHTGSTMTTEVNGTVSSGVSNTLSVTMTRSFIGYNTAVGTFIGSDYGLAVMFTSLPNASMRKRLQHSAAFTWRISCK